MQFDKETQVRILRVAADRIDGRPIPEMDAAIAQVMDYHPEFEEIWGQGELATYPQEIDGNIVNPFVHTVLHVIVDKQIKDQDPEFVAITMDRLMKDGVADRHEVLHGIIAAYAEVYFSNFRQGKPFDYLDYQSRLKNLYIQMEEG
ncbi:MAG: DUF1841 family protein [Candidatus Nitrohelix vancouverensis]|uniref:DUF1841 family protein n=1 Tax=Candidatus Nitrohelix vancouverensis TaxID=2705534 RepID=A0A7T0C2T8_9BACT|nr:MAG: DUF1841 family protein [Candidatus Nitrohelix vancouverensis]